MFYFRVLLYGIFRERNAHDFGVALDSHNVESTSLSEILKVDTVVPVWSVAEYGKSYGDVLEVRGFKNMFSDGRNAAVFDCISVGCDFRFWCLKSLLSESAQTMRGYHPSTRAVTNAVCAV